MFHCSIRLAVAEAMLFSIPCQWNKRYVSKPSIMVFDKVLWAEKTNSYSVIVHYVWEHNRGFYLCSESSRRCDKRKGNRGGSRLNPSSSTFKEKSRVDAADAELPGDSITQAIRWKMARLLHQVEDEGLYREHVVWSEI